MASRGTGNRARLDQVVAEFMSKSLHVILDARLDGAIEGQGSTPGTPSRFTGGNSPSPSSSSSSPTPSSTARWFNLELPRPSCQVALALEAWSRGARGTGSPLVVDIFLVRQDSGCSPASGPPGIQPQGHRALQGLPHRPFSSPDAFISLLAQGDVPVQGVFLSDGRQVTMAVGQPKAAAPAGAAAGGGGGGDGSAGRWSEGPALGKEGPLGGCGSGGEAMTLIERWIICEERRAAPGVAPAVASFGWAGPVGSGGALGAGPGNRGRSASAADVATAECGLTSPGGLSYGHSDSSASLETPVVYKHLVVLLRSLYSLARTLPAFRLHHSLASSSYRPGYRLAHRVLGGAAAAAAVAVSGAHSAPQDAAGLPSLISLPPVDMGSGRLSVCVAYCHTTTVTAVEVAPIITPHLIPDYVGSPLTDSVRRLPDSGRLLGSAVPFRRPAHIIPIVSSAAEGSLNAPRRTAPASQGGSLPGGPLLALRPSSLPLESLLSLAPGHSQSPRASGPLPLKPSASLGRGHNASDKAAPESSSPSPTFASATRLTLLAPATQAPGPKTVQAALGPGLAAQPGTSMPARPPQLAPEFLGPRWQHDLLRQNQLQEQRGGGLLPWQASSPLLIPGMQGRGFAPGESHALLDTHSPSERSLGEERGRHKQWPDGRGGVGLPTVGTAPYAIVGKAATLVPGGDVGEVSPAQAWFPASAPIHATGAPVARGAHMRLQPNPEEAVARPRGPWVGFGAPKQEGEHARLGQRQGQGQEIGGALSGGQRLSSQGGGAPSSALTAALTATPALPPRQPLPLGLHWMPGQGVGQARPGGLAELAGREAAPPQGQGQSQSGSELAGSLQSVRQEEEEEEGNLDLPFAVDDDDDADRSQGGHGYRPGEHLWRQEAGALPGETSIEHPGPSHSRSAAAAGSLVKLLKGAPPLRTTAGAPAPGCGAGGAAAGTNDGGGEGGQQLQQQLGSRGRQGDATREGMDGPDSSTLWLAHGVLLSSTSGEGQGWDPPLHRPSSSVLGASLCAPPVSSSSMRLSAAGPWHLYGKGLEAALTELAGFQELRDTLVRHKGLGQKPHAPAAPAAGARQPPPSDSQRGRQERAWWQGPSSH